MSDPLDTTRAREGGPWGGYRRRRAEGRPIDVPAWTMKDWIQKMKDAMHNADQGQASLGSYREKERR